uniref:SWI/SNF complex subunit SWI3D n=1 Tax=Tanacetum cinerariifolium TaxID=118510 RepID=A0A6L2N328_TANCI|nr:SWI/SNF complex subunit SWI3D [Tanacetum cinerariifolium]
MENSASPATTEQPPSDPPSSRRRGGKRKANTNNTSTPSSSSKRQAREKHSPVVIHNGPLTRAARSQPVYYGEDDAFWEAVVVNGSGGSGESDGAMVAPVAVVESVVAEDDEEEIVKRREAWEALEVKIEKEVEEVISRGGDVHVVPISCGWFSWAKVHPLEERALPSFFNGKSEKRTPDIYMDIRNSIMKRFHANPNTQLEEKDLSEISVGELDARKEVMEFLDYWGLINYHPLPEADVAKSVVDAAEAEKVNSLIQKLYEFEVEQLSSPAAPRSSFVTSTVPSQLPESVITDESLQPDGPSVEYHCNSCAADCSRKRYHCQKQADYDLCSQCFNDGKLDSDMSPSDFILMEPADATGASSGKWTDQETLLLLEALELFSENWNEIAEHVATKTKAQCILHFVQMPIEDTFRDCDDEDDESQKEKAEKKDTNPDADSKKKEVGASKEENADKVDSDVKMEDMTDTAPDDSSDKKETKDPKNDALPASDDAPSNNEQHESSPMEITESVDPGKLKGNQEDSKETGGNFAVKALREAFDAVGSLPSLDEKLSFADAGNPVMAMAAFLTRLVDPNIATASARTSLKYVSSGGTGLQLSARHSFILQGPTDEKTKQKGTERDTEVIVEQEAMKEKTDSGNKQEEEKSSNPVNDDKDKEGTNVTGKEKEKLVSNEKKEDPVKAEVVVPKNRKNAARRKGRKDKTPVAVAEKPVITEETNKQTHEIKNPSNSKESEDSAKAVSSVGVSEPTEALKDEEMVSKSPVPAKEEHPQSKLAENAENSGEAGAKDTNNMKKDTKEDPSMHNLTRAAVTAISAAAVKAKFLADQEEDQIRQLATSLVEKQLRKLETKLAFFTEMDGVVTRAREQLERSKQRLYHERAQIIAARLSMSAAAAAASRPMQNPLPNRPGMTIPNTVQRPPNPTGMTPQRPPLSRPMMAPTPPFSNTTVLGGAPAQIPVNQDQVKSVETK